MLAAVSAALGFNLFHTEPYLSLRIGSSDDLETAVLLLAVGLAVGELAVRGRRARALVVQERQDLASIRGLGALVADGEDADYVLLATASELTHLLGTGRLPVRGRPHPTTDPAGHPPRRHRPLGADALGRGAVGLPTDGAVIPVWTRGHRRGRFVLTAPRGASRCRPQQLAKAVALVDQAGASLAAAGAA